jgi:hypothetical protein
MRILATALLATTVCSGCAARPCGASARSDDDEAKSRLRPNVAAARELDREGVYSFREAHFADALRYFRMAYRLGGPSTELWNVARTLEKLDDGDGANRAIDEYLAHGDLSPQDRADAEREARALRSRSSMLSVTTTPGGATVSVDGKQIVGVTPISIEIAPGSHTVVVRLGYAAETRSVEARFGRAVIESLDLARADK